MCSTSTSRGDFSAGGAMWTWTAMCITTIAATCTTRCFRSAGGGAKRSCTRVAFHMGDSIVCRVNVDELKSMRALIREASITPPTEERQTAADAGGYKFTAYMYGETLIDSTEVVLATTGDFTREPSSAAADTLVKWLRRACACRDSLNTQ